MAPATETTLRFERTTDLELARRIISHPQIYPFLTSDGAPDAAHYVIPSDPLLWYVLVYDGDDLLGLFWLVPHTSVCWECHTCFLPHCRGARAIAAYRAGLLWLFGSSPCRKVLGYIPKSNRAALLVALRAGLYIIGTNKKSLLVDGELVDQIIVGIEG